MTKLKIYKIINPYIAISLLLILIVGILESNIELVPYPVKLLLNIYPVILMGWLLLLLTGKFFLSLTIVTGFTSFVYFANWLKLTNLDVPIIATDFMLLPQIASNMHLFKEYITHLRFFIAGIVFLGGFIIFTFYKEKTIERRFRLNQRLPLILLFLCCFLGLTNKDFPVTNFYHAKSIPWKSWEQKKNVENNGLIFSLVREASSMHFIGESVDHDLIAQFFQNHPEIRNQISQVKTPKSLPDIIVFLAESMFDPGILQNIGRYEYLKTLRAIGEKGIQGDLSVPTYGGNTTRTEFEVLTGISLSNYPDHSYPYMSLITNAIGSLPKELKRLGYETIAIHPHSPTFWNRKTVYHHLKFDDFISEKDFVNPDREGLYIADIEIAKKLANLLDDNKPQFFFIITMENHGPWGNRTNIDEIRRQSIAVPQVLPRDAHREFQEFVYHNENTEKAVSTVIDMINMRSTPTLLLIFGDHLPVLPKTYSSLKFDNELKPFQQKTPYIITANFPVKIRSLNTSSEFLASLILDTAGIRSNPFFIINSFFRELAYQNGSRLTEVQRRTLNAFQCAFFNNEEYID